MLSAQLPQLPSQLPLIHTIDEDDQLLLNSPDAQWYRILKYFPDLQYRQIAADYYNSLYHFNKTRTIDRGDQDVNDEEKVLSEFLNTKTVDFIPPERRNLLCENGLLE